MCHFISWIEFNGSVYFLDDNKLNTKEGRQLLKTEYIADNGHRLRIPTYLLNYFNMGLLSKIFKP